jgi:hypothetical protein
LGHKYTQAPLLPRKTLSQTERTVKANEAKHECFACGPIELFGKPNFQNFSSAISWVATRQVTEFLLGNKVLGNQALL